MGQDRVFVDLGNYKTEEVHPDLICLTAILLCNPFVGEELNIKFPMSKKFLKSVQSVITRYRLVASAPHIDEIKDRTEGVPGLAFSGGADSSAALALLPGECVPIFLWRRRMRIQCIIRMRRLGYARNWRMLVIRLRK